MIYRLILKLFKRSKKEINFLHTDFFGNRIFGKLILVDKLQLGDKFISITMYDMFNGKYPIRLTKANTDDVEISAANTQRYYIFKPKPKVPV